MTLGPSKKLRRRAERAEAMAIGMGFLLMRLQRQYGNDMGVGMYEQVGQAVKDYRRLESEIAQRPADEKPSALERP